MSKLEEHEGVGEIDEAGLADVSGGAIYMQYDGIKGSVTAEGSSHPSGGDVALADGSVR